MDGVSLEFSPEALDYIVDKAVEFKLGARGLRSIVESIMMDAMFEKPSEQALEFLVTREYAVAQLEKNKLQSAGLKKKINLFFENIAIIQKLYVILAKKAP